jgi:hypothetical protein
LKTTPAKEVNFMLEVIELSTLDSLKLSLKYSISEKHKKSLIKKIASLELEHEQITIDKLGGDLFARY